MLYIIPTKKGLGVEIWGNFDDMNIFYEFIGKFWNDENYIGKKGFESRDKLISGFSYEIRKAKDGNRLKRSRSHFSLEEQTHYGAKISWVHFLFSLTAIKYNMRYFETNKFDISMVLLLEFWLEKSMNSYDETGAKNLIRFIDDGIYGANELIYLYMRSINQEYFLMGGGKKAFRKLPELLKRAIFYSDEYKKYESFLNTEAKRLNIDIDNMEIDDDDMSYDIEW